MAYYRRSTAHPTVSTEQMSCNEQGVAEDKSFVDARPTPEDAYRERERSEIFQEAAEELPKRYQAAICLFYSRGLGEEATAKALGITLSALKEQLHRSRILLTYRIRKSCMPDVKQELVRVRPLMRSGRRKGRDERVRNRIAREARRVALFRAN